MDSNMIEALKGLGEVGAIMAALVFIVKYTWAGVSLIVNSSRETAKERNAVDQQRVTVDSRRNDLDAQIASAVEGIGKGLEAVVGRLEKLVSNENEIKEAVVGQHQVVIATMSEHDKHMSVAVEDLKLIRDQQYQALNSRLDKILQELGDVKDNIKALPQVTEKVSTISDKVANISEMVLSLKNQIKVNEIAQEKKDNGE